MSLSKCCPWFSSSSAVHPVSTGGNVPTVVSSNTQIPTLSIPTNTGVQERFGYHLSGQFEDKSEYDIVLYPNHSSPVGEITIRNETHPYRIYLKNFPTAWTIHSIANDLFQRKLIISKSQSAVLRDRSVEILYGSRNDLLPVRVDVRVQEVINNERYRLDIHTIDISASHAAIYNAVSNTYESIGLDYSTLRDLTSSDFLNHLPKLDQNLKVQVLQPTGLRVEIDRVIPDPNPPLSSPNDRETILNVHDVRGLCRLLGQDSRDAPHIAEKMVSLFTDHSFPSEGEFFEIGELISKLKPYDVFRILESLVRKLGPTFLQDEETLKLFTKIFLKYQQIQYQCAWEAVRKKIDATQTPDFLNAMQAPQLVETLRFLTNQLNHSHAQKSSASLVIRQLETIIALLDIMVSRKVENINFESHKNAYEALAKFKEHFDLRVDFLANCGTQYFNFVRNDTTKKEDLLRRANLFLRGMAKIDFDPQQPWKIFSILEAMDDFKEAFNFQDSQQKWFAQLLGVRSLVFGPFPEYFIDLIENLPKQQLPLALQNTKHADLFTLGFVDLLWEILHAPRIGTQEQDKKIKLMAVNLYIQIRANNEGIKKKEDHPFTIDEASRPPLRLLIVNRLQQCTTHSIKEVGEAASNELERLKVGVPQGIEPFIKSHTSTELFKRAVQQFKPLLLTLQSFQCILLNDKQLSLAKPYFTALNAKDSVTMEVKSLDDHLKTFLSSKKRVLAIGGAGGAGKSLGIKVFANNLLDSYTEQGYFPIFVSLPILINPLNSIIAETLSSHVFGDINQGKQDLLARKTVWIFDAYDEINFEKTGLENLNLYKSNNLDSLGDNVKIIFLYRSGIGVVPSVVFKPDGESVGELIVEPFNQDKIFGYLDQFCDVRERTQLATGKRENWEWDKKQYRDNFEKLKDTVFWGIITNPFRLRINAEIFPIIVEARRKDNVNFDLRNIFKGEEKVVIENRIFASFACIRAYRASRKISGQYRIEPVDFLEYQAAVAARMRIYNNLKAIPQKMEEGSDARKQFGDLFLGLNPKNNTPNRIFSKELEAVEDNQKVWQFMHEDYRDYFDSLNFSMPTKEQKQKLIDDTITKEKFDSLFNHD